MTFWLVISSWLVFIWGLLKVWGYTLVVPFTKLDSMWIIIPIWLSWFFAEFFQEKEGTSFGNAVSNGIVPVWVGIDWVRQITTQLIDAKAEFSFLIFGKYFISALILVYGLAVVIFGIKGKSFVKYLGRIREITYVLIVFTPFIYGLIKPDYKYFLAIIIFFPVFYGVIEIIDRLTPEPTIYKEDKEKIHQDQF